MKFREERGNENGVEKRASQDCAGWQAGRQGNRPGVDLIYLGGQRRGEQGEHCLKRNDEGGSDR